ncbi:heat stress transcription factor B-4-like protein [Tanacetum coccineum]
MKAPQKTVDGHHRSTHRRARSGLWYPGRMYVSGRVDIFDMVDIDLPLTSLDEGLYALACEKDVRCLATLVKSFKLIEVYIEHGVTALDSYLRAPRFRATLEEITDELGSIAANRTEKMLLLTWHKSSETTKEPVCDSVTPSSLPQQDSSTPCKDFIFESITPRCMPDCILTPPTDESFSDMNLSFVSQQATTSLIIDDVMRQLSFDEIELDGEAGFANVTRSGVDSSRLSHDESFGVDDLDLNLNEPINLNVSQVETQSELPVSKEPDVGRTQEPILVEVSTQEPIVAEVSTQEPIVAEVSTEVPIVEEVGTQEFSVEDVVLEDYVSSGEDAEHGNGQEDESAPTDGQFFYDDEGINTAYETEYDVQSSEDAGTDDDDDDDDVDEDFLVDEENEIVEPDVDVHLFGISMDLPFDNIGVTNLVPDDVLEGEDVDVINADSFDKDPGVINDSGQWKYSFYTGQKFTTPKEAKDRVYLHSIKSRRNLKLYKNDGVRIRARCDGKVLVFTMSQGTGPTSPNRGLEAGPSGSSGPTTRSKKGRIQYSMLRDYVAELQSTNPNTTVKITVERNTNPSLPTKVFQRIYVCLGALKSGFKACRRDLLGLDGAFMKGPFPGQVLVAVGLDSNNGIYPLAYALVEAESKSSWYWFLQCLGDDIDLHPNSNFTFISDRQKGWCGQTYKDLLWRAASATNVRDFEKYMLKLKMINPKAHEWLNKIPAEHWARSYFLGRSKSDLLLNNIYEVFNGKIVGGRDKPVITLLEYTREYCMKRIVNVQGVIDKCTGPLTHTSTRIMKSIKKEAHLMKVQWNGANKYQVLGSLGDRCVVDVVGRPRKKKKRSKHKDEPFVKDSRLGRRGRTITCQSCGNTGHNKATCKGQGRKATTVGQDGSGGSGAGTVIGLSAAAGEGGAGGLGVASQGLSHSRWTKRRVQTERINGREMGDGVPTQSSAASSASEWSFL